MSLVSKYGCVAAKSNGSIFEIHSTSIFIDFHTDRVPCSHVGHIYRGPRRRSAGSRGAHPYQVHINHLRVADVS